MMSIVTINEFSNPHEHHLSISMDEVSPIPLITYSSRKSSIDSDSFVNCSYNVCLNYPVATASDIAQ